MRARGAAAIPNRGACRYNTHLFTSASPRLALRRRPARGIPTIGSTATITRQVKHG
jgi:hypothetical protein